MGMLVDDNFSIIVNGRLRGKIFAKRGIRSGDPLTPFLFTIGRDALSCLIHYVTRKGPQEAFSLIICQVTLPTSNTLAIHFSSLLGRMEFWRLGGR